MGFMTLKKLSATLFFILIFTLSACTSVSTPPHLPISWQQREIDLSRLNHWELSGKLAAKTSESSDSGTFNWLQQENNYTLTLSGPLGAEQLKLQGGPGWALLETAKGKRHQAKSPEALLAQQWGIHLPVSYLKFWIRGLPVPHLPYQSRFDSADRLVDLIQQDWRIQFLAYKTSNNIDLPHKIIITSENLTIKLVLYQWAF